MSIRRDSESVRLRNVHRNADINENSAPYSNSSAGSPVGSDNHVDSTDGSGLERRPSRWNHAMDLMANLPSRKLSGVDSGDGTTERHKSMGTLGRNNSIWKAMADTQTRQRILSRQVSRVSDVENQDSLETMTEEEIWEKCQTIRDMPVSMEAKRQRKSELMRAQTMRLTGYDALKFKQNVMWRKRKVKFANFVKWLKFWDGSFKTVDGQFGMGVGSYFRFLRWLFFLNFYILLIIFGSVVIPQIVLKPSTFTESISALNLTQAHTPLNVMSGDANAEPLSSQQVNYLQQAIQCSAEYQEEITNLTNVASITDQIANFLQGKGFPEQTFLFYGHYFNKTYYYSEGITDVVYIMPIAYILSTAAYFILSLVLMVGNSAKGFKENFIDSQSRFFQYSCKIFTAWDYCMTGETASRHKQGNIYREFTLDMENERDRVHRQNRSKIAKLCLMIVRLLINIMVLITLAAAGLAIYYVNEKSLEWSGYYEDEYLLLAIQYSPSICITALNAVVPLIFIYIVRPESYSPEFEIKITLVRTVFLRLASLAVLIASLFNQISGCGQENFKCGNCNDIKCWETYVGQQFYKLAILDLLISIFVVLLYEFPRRKLVQRFNENKVFKLIGLPEFDIPRSVLDVIYGQTICWIGAFFCPIIPLIAVVKLFIAFYLKRCSLLRNFVSSARTYRASKSNSFFTIVLLVSFVLTTIPVGYSIGKIAPSQSCGPFRIYSSDHHFMFSTIGNLIASWPPVVGDIFQWLGSVSFIVPLIFLLCIAMYYYYIVASGHRKMIDLLKDQLAMEGRDKRFLIDRVSEALAAKYGATNGR